MTGINITEGSEQKEKKGNEKNEEKREAQEHEFRENEWMIRPCDMYDDEYSDCVSIKARFNQYFIFGETIDCSQWKKDYKNCVQWKKYRSTEAFTELIDSEKKRRSERLRAHYENDVWKKRDKPPENWNKPLPDYLQKKIKNNFLDVEGNESKSCTIS